MYGFERDWKRRLCLIGAFPGEVGDKSSFQMVMARFRYQQCGATNFEHSKGIMEVLPKLVFEVHG